MRYFRKRRANKSLEPTRDGAGSSAVADDMSWPRVAQLGRWAWAL